MKLKFTLPSLQAALAKHGLNPEILKDTQQISFIVRHEQLELPFFVKPFPETHLIQIVVYLPIQYTEATASDIAKTLHQINCDLDRPGWSMTDRGNLIFYRAVIDGTAEGIEESLVLEYALNLPAACHNLFPLISAVAAGHKTFQELFKE